jgi:hypothetical protein
MLAIQVATLPPQASMCSGVAWVGLESREKGLERPRIGVVENNPQIALGRDGEQPVVQDVGAPEVAVGIEGDAVDEAAGVLGPVGLALAELAVGRHAKARHTAAGGLDHVKPFLGGIEADLVGKGKAVGDDANTALIHQRHVAVLDAADGGIHPVLDPGRNGDPDAVFGIAQHEVDLADGLAVDPVVERPGLALTGHDFQKVGAEVGNQNVAVFGKGQAIGQRAFSEALGLVRGICEVARNRLRDDALAAIGLDVDDAAAGIGHPERAVAFGQDAFGPLQVLADVIELGRID